ncbi:NAD(P)-binding protein [Punctularia strigosozonata HHB-11173 SS5]|uniref:NAD(P)-binding protein n=1 Tax=Punctularia strigosozonata (strain HHB-11173) TaxID=741275 RepID=UPI0004416490|nr:NAD(P)-binding protein [Punctularia strigosozonata HHB-11173 SS5]EIN13001.1 NAD(P)-binding protein [Punctularia strigosozonata HHB-11173 SS5]
MMYQGKTALVTGSASGIGEYLVNHLYRNGATVVCADIREKEVQKVADSLNAQGSAAGQKAFAISGDVTKWDSVVGMFKATEELLKKHTGKSNISFVFANAGAAAIGFPFQRGEPNITSISVNLIGALYTIQAAINHFRKHRAPGRIIVTASQSSLHPFGGEPIYTASKHGVLGLVRATAIALENEKNITINAIGPGSTDSTLMPDVVLQGMNSRGWAVEKDTIMRAFDVFLKPDSKLSGAFVEAIGDTVNLFEFPLPTKDTGFKCKL